MKIENKKKFFNKNKIQWDLFMYGENAYKAWLKVMLDKISTT